MTGGEVHHMKGRDPGVVGHVLIVLNVIIVLVFCYVLVNRPDYSFIEASLAAGGLCLFLLVKSRN